MSLKFIKLNLFSISIFLVIVISGFLRFYDLGYSDYQGDEIKALFNVRNNKDFYEFLFDQRKGPNQFLLTNALREIGDNYYNYFVMRFPFALAGFISVILFYFVTKNFYNEKVALYSTIFFASSGFLIAFSRIVQYQSFVILLGLLTILLGQKFINTKRILYLYLGTVSLGFSILFHYDGIFFGVMFGLLVLNEIIKNKKDKKLILNSIYSGVLLLLTLASFYVPFVLNLDNATLEYFQERVEGVGGGQKISSSIFNFNLYQPYFSLYIYILFGVLGLIYIFKNYQERKNILVLVWVLVAFLFMELLIKSPGTHIYTYLIPLMLIMGLGINYIFEIIKLKGIKILFSTLVILLTSHLFLQSYVLFVEHSREYPWQEKNYLYFKLKPLTHGDNQNYYLSVFGFPYNRNWLEIREYLKDKKGFYDSSEKNTIGNFYLLNLKFKDKGENYVEIENPQSFSRANRREFNPVKVFENPNGTKSYIYFLK